MRDYAQAAEKADIVIGQVGAWSNPISLDEKIRNAGLEKNIRGLRLAEDIGALCCVNASGSLGKTLMDEHPGNLTEDSGNTEESPLILQAAMVDEQPVWIPDLDKLERMLVSDA